MKQAHLTGRLQGLRPSQQRRLEKLLHRRHPANEELDQSTLEKLAEEAFDLQQPLHMVLDSRGVCRLLCVGPLDHSVQLFHHLPDFRKRKKRDWRLISCIFTHHQKDLRPGQQDSIVALDLAPVFWLLFASNPGPSGSRPASIWTIDRSAQKGWHLCEENNLLNLCKELPIKGLQEINANQDSRFISFADSKERVLLLTLTCKDLVRSERDLAELEGLVRSAGACPVAVARQKQGAFNPQTIWGIGKLQEVALTVRQEEASLVITDRELTPSQARNLERFLACPVLDRSELILDIFAQRALSASGRLQVELAQLRYRKSRLLGRGKSFSRQGGGIGTRGPGETQLEKDRRAIVSRIERLGRDLNQLKKHRSQLRYRRKGLPRAALVGYTNAGKSSLLNALCGLSVKSQVLAENKLFATLDPTTRRLILSKSGGSPNELLITDTVGFIRDLPSPLMEAFRATLEETLEADLLLLLVDLANPDWEFQLNAVNELLDSLGVNSNRKIIANKIDCCERSALEAIRSMDQTVIYVSATSGAGLQGLRLWLQDYFWGASPNLTLGQQENSKHE
ncbi:GTPase HflX [Prochlorococcus sp. MIT 1307]|uniref:GTPase HflX n=1 Tax=Prochlorococcus sp. MIT 1307 TaxID=3096219 RepID=UPI002A7534E4|nr:GTPase HflX [Prochlorococcus sp. MIT 1307]